MYLIVSINVKIYNAERREGGGVCNFHYTS